MKTIRNYDEYGDYIEISLAENNEVRIKIDHYNNKSNGRMIELHKETVKSLIKDLKYIIGK
jgi:DNA-binding CsgD family transcriptional regulator